MQRDKTKQRVLIIGSPGIGKSTFAIWMLLLAMKDRKHVCIKPKKNSFFVFFDWKATKYDCSFFPTSGVIYQGYLDGDEDGCFFTYTNIEPAYLFSSPRDTNFNQFKKGAIMLCMNPWSKEESMQLATILKKEDECSRMFNLVGGKPRYLFEIAERYIIYVNIVKNSIPADTNIYKIRSPK
jgi:hypothetical protein